LAGASELVAAELVKQRGERTSLRSLPARTLVASMALVSAAIAVPLRLTSSRLTWAQGSLSTIVGIANIGLGCYIVYQSAIAGVVLGG
jgi:hypothetical protein